MSRLKDETITIRTSAEIKALLKLAAEREHRSAASMLEVLILAYAQEHRLKAPKTRANRGDAAI
jgi:uncharacterized protein (DUF1778 family)